MNQIKVSVSSRGPPVCLQVALLGGHAWPPIRGLPLAILADILCSVPAEYKCIVKAREILPYLNLIGVFINLRSGLGIDKPWSDIDLCNISNTITKPNIYYELQALPHLKYAANKKLEKRVHEEE